MPQAWRVFRDDDIVPEVPRSQGYTHVPHAVELAADERGLRLRGYLTMRAGDFPVSGQVCWLLSPNSLQLSLVQDTVIVLGSELLVFKHVRTVARVRIQVQF